MNSNNNYIADMEKLLHNVSCRALLEYQRTSRPLNTAFIDPTGEFSHYFQAHQEDVVLSGFLYVAGCDVDDLIFAVSCAFEHEIETDTSSQPLWLIFVNDISALDSSTREQLENMRGLYKIVDVSGEYL